MWEINKAENVRVCRAALEAKQPICRHVYYYIQLSLFSFANK